MLRNYLLIKAGDVVDDTTVYYKVKAGEGVKDYQKVKELAKVAKTKGWYFDIWNNQTDTFLGKIAYNLNKDPLELNMQECHINVMLKSIKATGDTPDVQPLTKQQRDFLMKINPAYYFKVKTSVIQKAEDGTRSKPKSKVRTLKCSVEVIAPTLS